jgi:hypothetical protein
MLQYAFEKLECIDVVEIHTDVLNIVSRQAIQLLGVKQEKVQHTF